MRTEIRRLWDEGAGHRGDHSAWEAFNALVQWLDHSPDACPDEERIEGLITGELGWTKRRVFVGLLRRATSGRGRAEAVSRAAAGEGTGASRGLAGSFA